MSFEEFTWIPVYRSLAEKLLEYEDRQGELISILKEAKDLDLPVTGMNDQGTDGPCELSEIDFFSFFANFNRNQKSKNRRDIISLICRRFGISVPENFVFHGIPSVNNQNSWFIPYKKNRKHDDVPSLWKLARTVLKGGLSDLDPALFERCRQVRMVAMTKLTTGLFWIRPDEFLPWDANTRKYMRKKGFDRKIKDFDGYKEMLTFARERMPEISFPDISHQAYMDEDIRSWIFQANPKYYNVSKAVNELEEMSWRVSQNFKQVKEGDRVYIWESGENAGIIAIATTTTDPTTDIEESDEEKRYYIDSSELKHDKYRVMLQIDEVLEKRLSREVLVEHPTLSELSILRFSNATNFAVSQEQDRALLELLQALGGQTDVPLCLIGTVKDFASYVAECEKMIESKGAWASWWSFPVKVAARDMLETPFSLYINTGGGMFAYRLEVSSFHTLPGSKGMETPWPEVTFEQERDKRRIGPSKAQIFKTWLKVTKIEKFDPPLGRSDMRPAMGLSTAGNLLNQNTFGYAFLKGADGPDTEGPYGLRETMLDLFIPEQQVVRILDLLREKKNVILQGPPGVGKTYVAKRLAYATMGIKDESRVQMVQFHQTYSYEDFIQGYRPGPGGLFERRNGVFYEFCQHAAEDPENDYVFIIDEINRGNLSRIFGELMMLIERDKRGEKYAIDLTYKEKGDKKFYVPENLYLIGLMNTADRSLAMVDYALRRRFAFVDLKPCFDSDVFKSYLVELGASDALITRIRVALTKLNELIEQDKDLGWGYCVGHSYFCPASEGTRLDDDWYRKVVENEVAPLMREYWFDKPASFHEGLVHDILRG